MQMSCDKGIEHSLRGNIPYNQTHIHHTDADLEVYIFIRDHLDVLEKKL